MFRILRALNLDIILGGLAVASLSIRHFQTNMPLTWWFILAGSIWIVYSLDRLLDAKRLKSNASTFRHRFHYRHFRPIALSVALISLLVLYLALTSLRWQILIAGFGLALFCMVYLLLAQIRHAHIPREPLVALGYVAGIILGPAVESLIGSMNLSQHQLLNRQADLAFFALLFLAAMLNLLVFNRFEYFVDRRDGQTSLMQQLSRQQFHALMHAILMLQILAWVLLIYFARHEAHLESAFVLLIVAPFPYIMLLARNFFKKKDRFRIYGDGIFLICAIPALYDWLAHSSGLDKFF